MNTPRPHIVQLQRGPQYTVIAIVVSIVGPRFRASTLTQSQRDAWRPSLSLPLQYSPFDMNVNKGEDTRHVNTCDWDFGWSAQACRADLHACCKRGCPLNARRSQLGEGEGRNGGRWVAIAATRASGLIHDVSINSSSFKECHCVFDLR